MKPSKTYTVEEATKKLENYCSYQERCHKEVISKLKEMNMIPLAIDEIIAHLIKYNFLNEERFAKTFVNGKFRIKKWGKYRITRELKTRDISKFLIDKSLKEISDENYLQTFHELAEKRFQQLKSETRLKKKKKLAAYLLYRGWESHLIYEKVTELIP